MKKLIYIKYISLQNRISVFISLFLQSISKLKIKSSYNRNNFKRRSLYFFKLQNHIYNNWNSGIIIY